MAIEHQSGKVSLIASPTEPTVTPSHVEISIHQTPRRNQEKSNTYLTEISNKRQAPPVNSPLEANGSSAPSTELQIGTPLEYRTSSHNTARPPNQQWIPASGGENSPGAQTPVPPNHTRDIEISNPEPPPDATQPNRAPRPHFTKLQIETPPRVTKSRPSTTRLTDTTSPKSNPKRHALMIASSSPTESGDANCPKSFPLLTNSGNATRRVKPTQRKGGGAPPSRSWL